MRNITITITAVFLFALLIPGCSNSGQKINRTSATGAFNVELTYQNEFQSGRNDIQLKLTDAYGEAVPGAKIEITPWMPDMGHGVMAIPRVTDKGKGKYDVLFMLSMGGLWELRMDIIKDELKDKVVFDFMAAEGKKEKK